MSQQGYDKEAALARLRGIHEKMKDVPEEEVLALLEEIAAERTSTTVTANTATTFTVIGAAS